MSRARRSPPSSAPPPLPPGIEADLTRTVDPGFDAPRLDRVVDRLCSVLEQGGRAPVLVGPPECGKTAAVRVLARRMAAGFAPNGARALWRTSLRALDVFGHRELNLPQRLDEVLHLASQGPHRAVLFLDDLRLLRAFDMHYCLAWSLRRSGAMLVGEAGPSLLSWLGEDPELSSMFLPLRVDAPDEKGTRRVLRSFATRLHAAGGPAIAPSVRALSVTLSERSAPSRGQPGKALELLENAARECSASGARRLTRSTLVARACEQSRAPEWWIDPESPWDAEACIDAVTAQLPGQRPAVEALVQRLALARSGLALKKRPLGSVLLAGPAGAGKARVVQTLAEHLLGNTTRLLRISLAEFGEDWRAEQLFGARGAATLEARRGLLSRMLAGRAFAMVLLDEVEKAHPSVLRHLLRPLDEGVLLNGNDEELSLRSTFLVLTTNVGAELLRPGLGYTPEAPEAVSTASRSLNRRLGELLSSELRERVDAVCVVPPLGTKAALAHAQATLATSLARWPSERFASEQVAGAASRAAEGAPTVGLRQLERHLEAELLAPLAMRAPRKEPASPDASASEEPA